MIKSKFKQAAELVNTFIMNNPHANECITLSDQLLELGFSFVDQMLLFELVHAHREVRVRSWK